MIHIIQTGCWRCKLGYRWHDSFEVIFLQDHLPGNSEPCVSSVWPLSVKWHSTLQTVPVFVRHTCQSIAVSNGRQINSGCLLEPLVWTKGNKIKCQKWCCLSWYKILHSYLYFTYSYGLMMCTHIYNHLCLKRRNTYRLTCMCVHAHHSYTPSHT